MPRVKLGDVAREYKATVKDNAGFPIVGLEHLSPGEITLDCWDTDVETTFTKSFKKGHMLFGRRRAYLKKAALAPFDGVCSGDIIVIEAIPGKINPELLPFIIQNDLLFDYAVGNSSGSLSPRVKWESLKEYEFELPEISKQAELVDLLEAAYNTKKAYQQLIIACDELVKSQFIELFGDPVDNPFRWETTGLLTVGDCKNGMNFGSNEQGVEIRSVGVGDVKDHSRIDNLSKLTLLSLNQMPAKEYLLKDEDIVFVRSNGNKNLVGRCVSVYPHDTPLTFSGFCIRFRKNSDKVLISYLLQLFKQQSVRAKLVGRGANIQNLNQKMLAALEIPIPPMHLQEEYKAFVEQLDKSKFELKQAIANVSELMKSLIQQDFTN